MSFFTIRGWNANILSQEKSRTTGMFGLGGQNETTQRRTVLSREHAGHNKYPSSTTEEMILHMDITDLSILKSDYVLCSQRWKNTLQSAKTRWSWLTVAQIMSFLLQNSDLNWRKWENQSFKYDIIQIWQTSNPLWLYSGSDKQIQGIRSGRQVTEELWTEVCNNVQKGVTKTIPKKKKCKKAKWLSHEETLQTA